MKTQTIDLPVFNFAADSIAKTYNDIFVPIFFNPWADVLLTYAGHAPNDRILDVATGPGTVALRAALRTSPSNIVGTDIAAPMLKLAASAAPGVSDKIEWIQADAASQPFENDVFDVVLCQQGLQFTPDKPATVKELVRVTKKGGRVAAAVWGPLQSNTVFNGKHRALRLVYGEEVANKMTAPFSFGSRHDLARLFTSAGFTDVETQTFEFPVIYPGGLDQVFDSMQALPVGVDVAESSSDQQHALRMALKDVLGSMERDGRIEGWMQAHLVRARA